MTAKNNINTPDAPLDAVTLCAKFSAKLDAERLASGGTYGGSTLLYKPFKALFNIALNMAALLKHYNGIIKK